MRSCFFSVTSLAALEFAPTLTSFQLFLVSKHLLPKSPPGVSWASAHTIGDSLPISPTLQPLSRALLAMTSLLSGQLNSKQLSSSYGVACRPHLF